MHLLETPLFFPFKEDQRPVLGDTGEIQFAVAVHVTGRYCPKRGLDDLRRDFNRLEAVDERKVHLNTVPPGSAFGNRGGDDGVGPTIAVEVGQGNRGHVSLCRHRQRHPIPRLPTGVVPLEQTCEAESRRAGQEVRTVVAIDIPCGQ